MMLTWKICLQRKFKTEKTKSKVMNFKAVIFKFRSTLTSEDVKLAPIHSIDLCTFGHTKTW